jgi:hypothetical protein
MSFSIFSAMHGLSDGACVANNKATNITDMVLVLLPTCQGTQQVTSELNQVF